jgi:F0F1-type ATP synthase assembly protein I
MQDTIIEDKQSKFRAVSIVGFIAGLMSGIFFIWLFRYFSDYPFSSPNILFLKLILNFILGLALPLSAIILGSVDLKKVKTIRVNKKGKGLDISVIVLGSFFLLLGLIYNVIEIMFNAQAPGLILFHWKEVPAY